jgi:probable F420-dependent oxidoreductase
VKFSTALPGLTRYPPSEFPAGRRNWQEDLGTEDFQQMARVAEALGYDALTVSEHVVMPDNLVANMGAYWPDAFTAMAFMAGATTRIRVNSSVIVLPYHQPVALAKAVTTLDVLSGGRVTVTVAAGMAEGAFAVLGVPFHRRGRVTDEYIEVMKLLWTEDHPRFQGEFVEVHDVVFAPKPVQRPHPPLWIGGSSMAALKRAARLGDGWAPAGSQGGKGPWLDSPEELPMFLDQARQVPGFAQREASFDISLSPVPTRIAPDHNPIERPGPAFTSAQEVVDRIHDLGRAGVTWTYVPRLGPPARSLEDHLEGLEWAAREVMAHFR